MPLPPSARMAASLPGSYSPLRRLRQSRRRYSASCLAVLASSQQRRMWEPRELSSILDCRVRSSSSCCASRTSSVRKSPADLYCKSPRLAIGGSLFGQNVVHGAVHRLGVPAHLQPVAQHLAQVFKQIGHIAVRVSLKVFNVDVEIHLKVISGVKLQAHAHLGLSYLCLQNNRVDLNVIAVVANLLRGHRQSGFGNAFCNNDSHFALIQVDRLAGFQNCHSLPLGVCCPITAP